MTRLTVGELRAALAHVDDAAEVVIVEPDDASAHAALNVLNVAQVGARLHIEYEPPSRWQSFGSWA